MGEDEVTIFDRLVAGKAGFEHSLDGGFAVLIELSEPPATRRGIPLGVLDHKLEVPSWRGAGDEGLRAAKYFVVFLRRDVFPRYSGNDGAVWKWKPVFAIRLDRHIITQNGADIVEAAFFVGHGDQLPIAIPVWDLLHEDGRGIFLGCHGRQNRHRAEGRSRKANCSERDLLHFEVRPSGLRCD